MSDISVDSLARGHTSPLDDDEEDLCFETDGRDWCRLAARHDGPHMKPSGKADFVLVPMETEMYGVPPGRVEPLAEADMPLDDAPVAESERRILVALVERLQLAVDDIVTAYLDPKLPHVGHAIERHKHLASQRQTPPRRA